MSKGALLIVMISVLTACSSSEPDGDVPGGQDAGDSGEGGSGGNAGTTHAGSGGSGGMQGGAGAGGMSSGSGGMAAGSGGGGAASGAGGATGGGGGAGGSGAGGDGGTGGDHSDAGTKPAWYDDAGGSGCVVAKRIDECCFSWHAVDLEEAIADPCLVGLGEPVTEQEAADCFPTTPNCALVDCFEPLNPPSRVVMRGDGACMFTDECMTPADCVLARDDTQCCSCLESTPKSLVESAECIVAEGEGTDFALCSSTRCLTVLCAACEQPDEPTCAIGDALNACR